MSAPKHRYVFTDYKNIQSVKLKKLEKVCQKLFILIDASEEFIPFSLVRDIQKFGNTAKWISIKDSEHTLDYHIIYLMGKMHSKISKDIEFAILSENENLSSIIRYINQDKRSCIRIRFKEETLAAFPDRERKPPKKNNIPTPSSSQNEEQTNVENKAPVDVSPKKYPTPKSLILSKKDLLIKASHATIERLQLLSEEKRPFNRDALLEYIDIHNEQWAEKNGEPKDMIDYLVDKAYIKFVGDIISYHLPTLKYQDSLN